VSGEAGGSLTKLSADSPAALLLLSLLAHLDGEALPIGGVAGAGAAPRGLSPGDVGKAVALLEDRGFIESGQAALAVRPQVKALVRESLPMAEVRAGAEAAVELLLQLFPEEADDFVNWSRCEPLAAPAKAALRSIGELRFSGAGTPRRWPAPAEVALVSTNTKSAALLFVSCGVSTEQAPKVVIEPPLPQLSR